MTDTPDFTPPFPGFPGFPPAEMLERMWGMMRLSPFGSAFSGAQPAGGMGPSLSMMSDMMAPLTNVEELDKRITDMRAVEQWLKLNLSMLQSAIQALEVQRATLATLRAFGAFAQSSMAQPAASAAPTPTPATGWPHPRQTASASGATASGAGEEPSSTADDEETPSTPPFDASAWWSLLQSQFNQIAQFAMTQPAAATGDATQGAAPASGGEAAAEATADASQTPPQDAQSAARRPAAKRAPSAAKRTASASATPRAAKKST